MKRLSRKMVFFLFFFIFISSVYSQEFPVSPYVDKNQYIKKWPDQSFYKQPWRSYMETVRGKDFLDGIGIGFNFPWHGNFDTALKVLSESGFKNIRIEIGWSNVPWDEDKLINEENIIKLFQSCKKYGIKPLILLNAHHGYPCPMKYMDGEILEDAKKEAREIKIKVSGKVIPHYTALAIDSYTTGDIFITDYKEEKAILSRPLYKELKKGDKVYLRTYKYLPAHPVGTKEFEEMAEGWMKYVKLVCNTLKKAGLGDGDFEIEIWNELSFGSMFMGDHGINHYYNPPKVQFKGDFLHKGGHAWEIARRTVNYIKENYPNTRVIWGFSNTTFYHTPIVQLPPKIDGQSYHPYGTGKRIVSKDYPPESRYPWYVEGYIPDELSWCMPEGWAHLQVQCETLIHHLYPESRKAKPEGVERFYHYMTEHGFSAFEAGIGDEREALDYKAKAAIRSLMFWINKGISKVYIFCAYDKDNRGMGILPSNIPVKEYSKYPEEQLFTPAMKALKNVVDKFKDSEDLKIVRHLDVDVVSLGKQYKVFKKIKYIGKEQNPPPSPELYYRDMFVFLPFQVNKNKFVCGVYVMSYDITNPPPPMKFRVNVKNVYGKDSKITYYDPIEDRNEEVKILEKGKNNVKVEIEAIEYPRLLIVQESKTPLTIKKIEIRDITPNKAKVIIETNFPSKKMIDLVIYNYHENFYSDIYSAKTTLTISDLLPSQFYSLTVTAEDKNDVKISYPSFIWEKKIEFKTPEGENSQQVGLNVEYYFSKNPGEFTELKKAEISPFIHVDNEFLKEKIGKDQMVAIRWKGEIYVEKDGKYTFYTVSDDGVRVKVDNKTIIEDWTLHGAKEDKGEIELKKGWHKITIEYFQGLGEALFELYYSSDEFEKTTIPVKFLKLEKEVN